jgi:hypothetical protein
MVGCCAEKDMKGLRLSVLVSLLLAPVAGAENACVDVKASGIQPVMKRGAQKDVIEAVTTIEDPTKQEKRLRELTECAVAPGTPVKVLESATTFATIEVLDGSTKGCTGEILRSSLGTCPAATP